MKIFFIFIAVSLLLSCNDNPTKKDMQNVFMQYFDSTIFIKSLSFKYEKEIKHDYIRQIYFYVDAEIEFKKDFLNTNITFDDLEKYPQTLAVYKSGQRYSLNHWHIILSKLKDDRDWSKNAVVRIGSVQ